MDLCLVVGLGTAASLSSGCDWVFGLDRPSDASSGSNDARLDQPLIDIEGIAPLRPRVGVGGAPAEVTATITGIPDATVHHRFQTDQGGQFDLFENAVHSSLLDANGTVTLPLGWTPTALADVTITGQVSYAPVIEPSNTDVFEFGVDRVLGHYAEEGNTLSFGTDTIIAMKLTTIEAGTVSLIGVVAGGATQTKVGVYAPHSTVDQPGMLYRGTAALPIMAGRNELSLAGGGIAVQLGAGEDFWIAVVLGPGTAIAFGSAGMPSSLTITTPGSFADGLPLSFPTNFTQLNVTPKLYAVMRM